MSEFDDLDELEDMGLGYPKPKEKEGIYSFLNKVLKTPDTTKVGHLDEEELRVARLLQSTSLYSSAWDLPEVETYLKKEAEILLASSDSKNGFLVTAAITSKKQIERKNKSSQQGGFKLWGKKQDPEQEEQ
jgi:hypothetical protein